MTDILDRLRIEAQREPHEPIWTDAIEEIQVLRVRVEALELLLKMRELPLAEKSPVLGREAVGARR